MTTLCITLPIRTTNPLNGAIGNSRLSGILRAKQRAGQRSATRLRFGAELRVRSIHPSALLPCTVTLTRLSSGKLDGDGLQASFKAIRDGIADVLKVNDGGELVVWRYEQRRCPRLQFGVEVAVEPRSAP